jgi:transcriptional regulator with XRE-family HTH domain
MKKTIGDRIHELRRVRKLTQAELANKAGIPAVSLSVTERGLTRNPSFSMIWKIANALEVDLNTFVSGVEMENQQ